MQQLVICFSHLASCQQTAQGITMLKIYIYIRYRCSAVTTGGGRRHCCDQMVDRGRHCCNYKGGTWNVVATMVRRSTPLHLLDGRGEHCFTQCEYFKGKWEHSYTFKGGKHRPNYCGLQVTCMAGLTHHSCSVVTGLFFLPLLGFAQTGNKGIK